MVSIDLIWLRFIGIRIICIEYILWDIGFNILLTKRLVSLMSDIISVHNIA